MLTYSYKVGNGHWQVARISPGHQNYYWHQYEYVNENRSPAFLIKFDADPTPAIAMQEFRLKRASAPAIAAEFGQHYDFVYQDGGPLLLVGN